MNPEANTTLPYPHPKSICFQCDNMEDFKKHFYEYSHREYFRFAEQVTGKQEEYDKTLDSIITSIEKSFEKGNIVALCDDSCIPKITIGSRVMRGWNWKYIVVLDKGIIKKQHVLSI